MKKIISLLLCFLIISLNVGVYADEISEDTTEETVYETVDEVLAAAEELGADNLTITKNFNASGQHYIKGASEVAHTEDTDSEGDECCRVEVKTMPNNASHVQLRYLASGVDVSKGDIVFFSYKVRAISSSDEAGVIGTGYYRLTSSGSVNATEGFVIQPGGEKAEWIQCYKAAEASYSHDADTAAHVDFILGATIQTVEIKDINVINFKDKLSLDSLPKKELTYEGMEEGAQWRIDANERIEKIRKSDIAVSVVDGNGNPIEGATVKIDQKRHSYGFGSMMSIGKFNAEEEERTAYLNRFLELFNLTGFENAMKPQNIAAQEENIKNIMSYAKENDLNMRGHTLVWKYENTYNSLTEEQKATVDKEKAEGKYDTLKEIIRDHIDKYTFLYADRIDSWDVVNELANHQDDFYNLPGFGIEELAKWFELAYENDPTASLVYNDFGMLSYDSAKQNFNHKKLEELLELGAPVTTMGMQAHLGSAVAPEQIIRVLDKFSDLGVDIEITEFTYSNSDEEFQAQYLSDFLTAVFSHPSTSSVYLWGFAKGATGRSLSTLCNRDMSLKPSGEAWLSLVKGQWWTNVSGKTNSDGVYTDRAFHGSHEITVETVGGKASFPIELGATAKKYVVVCDENFEIFDVTDEFSLNGLRITTDRENAKLTIEGNGDFVGGADASLLVTNTDKEIVYFDQTSRLAVDGSFRFDLSTSNFLKSDSRYLVKIGSQGRTCVKLWMDADMQNTAFNIESLTIKNSSNEAADTFADLLNSQTIDIEADLHSDENQTLVVGMYDENNNLLKATYNVGETNGISSVKCTAQLDVSNVEGGAYLKIFLWDRLTSLKPFASAVIFD